MKHIAKAAAIAAAGYVGYWIGFERGINDQRDKVWIWGRPGFGMYVLRDDPERPLPHRWLNVRLRREEG